MLQLQADVQRPRVMTHGLVEGQAGAGALLAEDPGLPRQPFQVGAAPPVSYTHLDVYKRQGGERVNRDGLDAEQQFYGARRDLAEARYAYLNAWLRLRQLAGMLEDRDLAVLAAYFGAGEGRAQVAAAIR